MCASKRVGVAGVAIVLAALIGACGGESLGVRKARPAARTVDRATTNRLPRTKELPNDDGADPALKQRLDRVAGCFSRAVAVLQSEPVAGKLGRFLQRGLATGRARKACGGLRFGKGLLGEVQVQAQVQAWSCPVGFHRFVVGEDFFDGGHTVLHIRYRFSCEGKPARAEATIQRGFGMRP